MMMAYDMSDCDSLEWGCVDESSEIEYCNQDKREIMLDSRHIHVTVKQEVLEDSPQRMEETSTNGILPYSLRTALRFDPELSHKQGYF